MGGRFPSESGAGLRRNTHPDWQRTEVWNEDKKRALIDTILRGWKLPKFYFLKTNDEPESYEVVDGQQRLSAIFDFLDNELRLADDVAERVGGSYYKDLPDPVSDSFDDFEIEFDEIVDSGDEEIKEFFRRLQEGLPLTASERLNAAHGNLRDFAVELSESPFLLEKVGVRNHRHALFDIVAKVLAIEVDGFDVGLRYDDILAVFNAQKNFSKESGVANRVTKALAFLNRSFPEKESRFRNRTLVQSFLTLATGIVQAGGADGYEPKFRDFFDKFIAELSRQVELGQSATDQDYLKFQRTVNANVKAGPGIRHNILTRKLLAFDPSVVSRLSGDQVAASGLDSEIPELGARISRLVAVINEAHAVKSGADLFKPTNKTTAAQASISRPIRSFEEYKGFVESLYFLFWEGPGQRLDGKMPDSFKDINALRTNLQHDVDHGKPSRVKKKRIGLGQAFVRYAGSGTPETVGPESLLVLQANLLRAIENDLHALHDELGDHLTSRIWTPPTRANPSRHR